MFTDLDRERRQQAFIISLATQLKAAGTLANPVKLSQIINVTKQNTAIDSGLDLLSFAREADNLAGGNVTFYTLPVESFGKAPTGEDINVVDPVKVKATVAQLVGGASASASTTAPATASATSTAAPTTGTSRATKTTSSPSSSPTTPTVVEGTGTPAPTDLTAIAGGGIPCVK